ncbi:ABC transporter ATP-binding protein [Rubrobacter xylanophilus]|uniref:ABC transporter ATP-binding protein n=2 Tax=Rubrobacter xylanophilus TaxID=49319 RepID=A0A510HHN9_9ACTN|nr:ABC transporter ATP-binding protein [Rubrobacter xylanophilus]
MASAEAGTHLTADATDPNDPAKENTVFRLAGLIRPMWRPLLLAGLATLGATGATLALPWSVQYFMDGILSGSEGALGVLATSLLLLFAVQGIFSSARIYLLAYAGQSFVKDLMVRVYSRTQRFPLNYFDRERTGELISRISNDTTLIRNLVSNNLVEIVSQVVTVLGAAVLMFVLDWRMSLLIFVAVPFVVAVGAIFGRQVRKVTGEVQKNVADLTSIMEQTFGAIRVVKSFAREDHEQQRFADGAQKVFDASMRQAKISAILGPAVMLIVVSTLIGVLYYGGHRVVVGTLPAGEFVAFLIYMVMMSGPATGLTGQYTQLQQALAASDRIFSLMDTAGEDLDASQNGHSENAEGRIEFSDVSFSYDNGEKVLHEVSFDVSPGETVALVGPSGAGKSTLVSLLLRFYEIDSGEIFVDGTDIRELGLRALRSRIGLVAQDVALFSGTVRDNIRYGKLSATDAEVEAAARAANAHEFVSGLENGYDSLIGERGVKLSGGQRQRLSIARTLLSDPGILVLDEATSNLDAESEALVQDAVSRLMAQKTALVIAHRLSTVVNADRIVVLDSGRIVAQGTHAELMGSSTLYRRLYTKQLGGNQKSSSPTPKNCTRAKSATNSEDSRTP